MVPWLYARPYKMQRIILQREATVDIIKNRSLGLAHTKGKRTSAPKKAPASSTGANAELVEDPDLLNVMARCLNEGIVCGDGTYSDGSNESASDIEDVAELSSVHVGGMPNVVPESGSSGSVVSLADRRRTAVTFCQNMKATAEVEACLECKVCADYSVQLGDGARVGKITPTFEGRTLSAKCDLHTGCKFL